MSFLQRMDTNHNGMLDPSETQGRARGFLERIAQEAKLDLNRPIKLEKIAKAFEKMRERRMQEMARGGSSSGSSRGSDRGNDRGGSSRGTTEVEPLVPGFGEPELYDPVPGFGTLGEQFAVKVEDSDRREAERTMRRYDENRDGVLDKKEISRGRWTEDPLKTDRNHDGKLSLNELALRYAMRRAAREGSSSSRSASSSRRSSSSSSRSSRSSSSGSNSRTEMIARMMLSRYDRNKNGVLEQDEWKQFRTDPSAADTNHDRKITSSELAKWIANRMGSRGSSSRGSSSGRSGWYARRESGDSRSRGGSSGTSSASSEDANGKSWYRLHSPTELLPEGLPEWFAQRDGNGDGQVMMHEFATSWSQSVAADFTQFDLNGDGVITPKECQRATEAGAVLGSPGSTAFTSTSSSDTSSSSSVATRSSSSSKTSSGSATPTASAAEPLTSKKMSKAARRYVKYAVGYIKRYDKNHDGVLVKEEWSKMSKDYSPADADGDGKITPTELADYMMKQWK